MVNSSVTIYTLPCLSDNYAYVVHNSASGTAAVVDVPEAGPLVDKISELNVPVTDIFLTHHHWDHIDGLPDLQAALTGSLNQAPARVIGAKADAHRLPALDQAVSPGDRLTLCGIEGDIYDVSGHTLGHLALHLPSAKAVFTADSLMAMGCGRLFEGSAAQMWHSLQQLRALPQDTWVYSGHEYTASNMAFTQSLGEDNPAIAAVPLKSPKIALQVARRCQASWLLKCKPIRFCAPTIQPCKRPSAWQAPPPSRFSRKSAPEKIGFRKNLVIKVRYLTFMA